MTDLSEFLLARIAEDEEAARQIKVFSDQAVVAHLSDAGTGASLGDLVVFDPARVLAECNAKRRLVAEHPEITVWHESENPNGDRIDEPEWLCGRCVNTGARQPWTDVDLLEYPCPTLRLLALPYREHPDYRSEWAAS